jgi:hypothetical protein
VLCGDTIDHPISIITRELLNNLIIESLWYIATLKPQFRQCIIFLYLVNSDLVQEVYGIQELVPLFGGPGFTQQSVVMFSFCQNHHHTITIFCD